jgi:hypothetical protein
MLKKVLIGVGIVMALLVIAGVYLNYRNRTLSPPAEQKITTDGGLVVNIDYSRPSKRDRIIFGDGDQGALQPYGKYWRLGANEATVINFSEKVMINGIEVPAGSYGLYAIPGPDLFDIGINKTWDRWGVSEPDYSQDVTRFKVPIEKLNTSIEQFTINLGEDNGAVKVICEWDNVRFVIPVEEIN